MEKWFFGLDSNLLYWKISVLFHIMVKFEQCHSLHSYWDYANIFETQNGNATPTFQSHMMRSRRCRPQMAGAVMVSSECQCVHVIETFSSFFNAENYYLDFIGIAVWSRRHFLNSQKEFLRHVFRLVCLIRIINQSWSNLINSLHLF